MSNKNEVPPQDFFLNSSGSGDCPWEIGRTQDVIVKLVEQGIFHGELLDCGCGVGDNAIYIANHSNNVHITAIDLGPKAIEVARQKAVKANVNIQFEVVNMLEDLSQINLKAQFYDIVLDGAVFHLFSDEHRLKYIENLGKLIKPGGLYIQIVFSEKEVREGGPRRITKGDLNELFSSKKGWTIESSEDAIYQLRDDTQMGVSGNCHAYLSFIRRNL